MDAADGQLYLGRPLLAPWKRKLNGMWSCKASRDTIEAMIAMHSAFAKATGGRALSPMLWRLLKTLVTPHPLGGCSMADTAATGVVDHRGQVFGYPVKIINWTLTMWGGKLYFSTAMLFAIGLIIEFTIGGLSGVTHAVAPSDTQQTDTYYIVAHFHYVIFGGGVLGLFAGMYYWWPKIFGKMLSETIGKWNFWLMIIGMNMTFGPMHILGLQGQPRRMYVWTEERSGEGFFNLGFWNLVSSIGTVVLVAGVFMFLVNVWVTRKAPPAPADPWDARSLEWITSSPPKEYNFERTPTVHALDEFFHRKYEDVGTGDHHEYKKVATGEEVVAEEVAHADAHIHLPSPSYWPIMMALALPIMSYGVIYNTLLIVVGAALLVGSVFGWALEPSTAPDSDFDPPADGGETSKELAVHV